MHLMSGQINVLITDIQLFLPQKIGLFYNGSRIRWSDTEGDRKDCSTAGSSYHISIVQLAKQTNLPCKVTHRLERF